VLNGLLDKYEVQLSKLEDCFGSTTNPLMIQDMQNKLNLKYAQLKCLTTKKTEMDQALAAFCRCKVKCSNCSKFGHKTAECCFKTMMMTMKEEGGETKKSKNGKKPTDKQRIMCFGCGKKGHYQSKCPENENDNKEETDITNSTLNS